MKLCNANKVRKEWVEKLLAFVTENGEDTGIIASNSFNFPIVVDGEEGWVEIVVKVPKENGDEGFDKREDWKIHERLKAEKEAKKKAEKEKKIARDKAYRESKKKKKENE